MKSSHIFLLAMLVFSCGYSPNDQLFISASEGNLQKVMYLIKSGANVNHRFQYLQKDFQPYETPIIAAAKNGHLKIVKVLVEAGAQVDSTNSYNSRNAIYLATMNKHRKIIDYLLGKDANAMSEQILGKNLLMIAIEQDDFSLIKQLVKYGAWPDPEEKDGEEVAGSVAKDALQLAIALKRPYVNYLRQQRDYCKRIFKTKLSCKRF